MDSLIQWKFIKMLTEKMQVYLNSKVLRIAFLILVFLSIAESAKRLNGFSQGPIICPVRLLTNIPCPACGTTRSIGSIAIGDFDRAWNLNPLGYLVYLLAIIWAIFPGLITRILYKPPERGRIGPDESHHWVVWSWTSMDRSELARGLGGWDWTHVPRHIRNLKKLSVPGR